MPTSQNRSNCAFRYGFLRLATDSTAQSGFKCNLCYERHRNGQAPACSTVCPSGCIFWGDATSLSKRIEEQVA
ncbi:MAG: hypothetical protein JSV50_07005 [Desulfobacteraceae bacterium]|nr:MAG: hypothetical protein JSV50_07005 [Desulfobacteraceae bacterium]